MRSSIFIYNLNGFDLRKNTTTLYAGGTKTYNKQSHHSVKNNIYSEISRLRLNCYVSYYNILFIKNQSQITTLLKKRPYWLSDGPGSFFEAKYQLICMDVQLVAGLQPAIQGGNCSPGLCLHI
jgi:hypothetical protein